MGVLQDIAARQDPVARILASLIGVVLIVAGVIILVSSLWGGVVIFVGFCFASGAVSDSDYDASGYGARPPGSARGYIGSISSIEEDIWQLNHETYLRNQQKY